MKKGRQKYPTAYHWLQEKCTNMSQEMLIWGILQLAQKVDPDDIIHLWLEEMEEDGYFDE